MKNPPSVAAARSYSITNKSKFPYLPRTYTDTENSFQNKAELHSISLCDLWPASHLRKSHTLNYLHILISLS